MGKKGGRIIIGDTAGKRMNPPFAKVTPVSSTINYHTNVPIAVNLKVKARIQKKQGQSYVSKSR